MNTWNASGARFSFVATAGAPDLLAAYDLGAWNGWIAMTYLDPKGSQSPITGVQMLVNTYYEWSPAHPKFAHSDTAGAYDLESVLTHEFGHYLHLNDEQTAQDVMQPTITPGVIRRRLGVDDISGAQYLYPMLAQFSVERLAEQAELVIRGRVVATRIAVMELRLNLGNAERAGSAIDLMFTVHRVEVLAVLRGIPNGRELDVITLGGETTERSLYVDSEAALYPKEEVILFLSKDHERLVLDSHASYSQHSLTSYLAPRFERLNDVYSVCGGFQGKYSIYTESETQYVLRQSDRPAAAERMSFEELRQQIQRGDSFAR